ncbi:MAG: hypothetical protein IPJ13_16620 [Saprospiraceae bacterium]|nr:hypothetical protein [Saprospiraceae bacterium]
MSKKPISKNITYIFIAVVITAIIAIFYPWEKKEWRFSDIVVSPDVNAKVAIGAPLTIKLNEEKLSEADSVIVRYTGNQADAKSNFGHTINTSNLPLGYQTAEITVHDGKIQNGLTTICCDI